MTYENRHVDTTKNLSTGFIIANARFSHVLLLNINSYINGCSVAMDTLNMELTNKI